MDAARENLDFGYLPMSAFGFMSHVPLLVASCLKTTGPVLELGAGFGSTFALHAICAETQRMLVTLESSLTWLREFEYYKRPWHRFRHVKSFIGLKEYDEEWEMAFIDHGILGERGPALWGVRNVPVIVVHDTNHEELNYTNPENGVKQPLRHFKYRYDYRLFGPQTSVVSNSVDVNEMFKEADL